MAAANIWTAPAYTQGAIDRTFESSVLFRSRVLRELNHGVFVDGADFISAPGGNAMAWIFVAARAAHANAGIDPPRSTALAGLMGEYAGLMNAYGDQVACRDHFTYIVRSLLAYTQIPACRFFTDAHRTHNQDMAAENPPVEVVAHGVSRAQYTTATSENLQIDHIRAAEGVSLILTSLPTTFADAYAQLQRIAQVQIMQGTNYPALSDIHVSSLFAVCKRGQATPEYIQRTVEAMRTDTGINVNIDAQAVTMFYNLGIQTRITPEHARSLVALLTARLPMNAIKMRNLVEQMVNSGLTAMCVILSAIRDFPGFPWGVVENEKAGELASFQRACRIVAGDVYYAYRPGSLQDAAQTRYKVLFWVARNLYVKSGKAPTLAQYGNANAGRQNLYQRISRVIDTYLERQGTIQNDGTPLNIHGFDHEWYVSRNEVMRNLDARFRAQQENLTAPLNQLPVPDEIQLDNNVLVVDPEEEDED